MLHALAVALRLDRDEIAHLYALAGPRPIIGVQENVSDEIQQLLDSWQHTPAYVRNRRFDVLAVNKLAMALSPLYLPGKISSAVSSSIPRRARYSRTGQRSPRRRLPRCAPRVIRAIPRRPR